MQARARYKARPSLLSVMPKGLIRRDTLRLMPILFSESAIFTGSVTAEDVVVKATTPILTSLPARASGDTRATKAAVVMPVARIRIEPSAMPPRNLNSGRMTAKPYLPIAQPKSEKMPIGAIFMTRRTMVSRHSLHAFTPCSSSLLCVRSMTMLIDTPRNKAKTMT